MNDHPEIQYFPSYNNFGGFALAPEALKGLLKEFPSKRILEIGSGANPTLPIAFVQNEQIEYTTNDISEVELNKAPPGYQTLLLDLNANSLPANLAGKYDFIFSRMVNEHVKDGELYYRNIRFLLSPCGITAHWFPTLFSLPFLANWLLPDKLTDWLVDIFMPRDRYVHAKFPAYYSWSRGPLPGMIRRFERLDFRVLRYVGYFGHGYYEQRLPWLHKLEVKKSEWLARHPIPLACSFANVILQRI
jgi:hypothetical protein